LLNQEVGTLSGYLEGSLLAAVTATENKFQLVGAPECCVSVENTGHCEAIAGSITGVIKPSDSGLNARYQCFWYLLIDSGLHGPTL
jgi:hypothetical protein